ncbi:hypothetical protein ASJ33_00650 [Dehalococcoides mccartyi]|jgi:hypothetical protein|uniref:DUF3800 domain-containing protein n=1 Tax=Dehalococcoides mccartyi TaxID=61435 RepID=UPI0004E073C9|nr:DUF3800 domain-containing protein [Dehalococcoides mccartyi]AII58642.1 hypothetical protein X792_00050 [Dehalococcoides mccartyi CG1]APH11764.1 hypothetical protein ASJ33_00650 [Dehalococcoides mccartyi]
MVSMETCLIFSDEAGTCGGNDSNIHCKNTPFYVRANLIVNTNNWKNIYAGYEQLFKEMGFPSNKEVKWSEISEYITQTKKKSSAINKSLEYLKNYSYDSLLGFTISCLNLLKDNDVKVILTISSNENVKFSTADMINYHIINAMERLEMVLTNKDILGLLFCDSLNKNDANGISEAYKNQFENPQFIKKYRHIFDSIMFLDSDKNCCIRLVDYICGITNGMLKGFETSQKLFLKNIYPLVIKSPVNNPFGYGIKIIPDDSKMKIKQIFVKCGVVSDNISNSQML